MEEKGLYKKILNVMQAVEHLSKDGLVDYESHGKKTKYNYVTEEKVTSTVRKALIEEGLVILPCYCSTNRIENLTTVECSYWIVDINTGQKEQLQSVGQGSDSQDKGSNKALTGAYKYLLLRTFAIPTGDDPDKVSSSQLDDEGKERKISAIMEFFDHEDFKGVIPWKKEKRDLVKYRDAMIPEIPKLSMQRLTTLLKNASKMFALATNQDADSELNDEELSYES